MSHWIILPILLPALAGAALLLLARRPMGVQRLVSGAATLLLTAVCVGLVVSVGDAPPQIYLLGNWPAPFGIVLVLDRLSALMLVLTAVVALASLAYAANGWDERGRSDAGYFHSLFQFQLMGLNGAFLTGDLFNLFVFFEVLLIASYGLLVHGGGADRARAGILYVVINLAGSALFLVGIALLYGTVGTLNMADLSRSVAHLDPEGAVLAQIAGLLLLVVFGVKAALFPLYFWLPPSYTAASAPVAAVFAIMTKVGVYSIIRVFTLVFGEQGGPVAGAAAPWLLPAGLVTLALATLGLLASKRLGRFVAYLTIASVGTMLAAVGLFTADAMSSALFYLVHSTLVVAALFLLTDMVAGERGATGDHFQRGPRLARPMLLSVGYLLFAATAVGLPPFSGFFGKLMILDSAQAAGEAVPVWSVVLVTGLLTLYAAARAGSILFWATSRVTPPGRPTPTAAILPFIALGAALFSMVLLAAPLRSFTDAAARQLFDVPSYTSGILAYPALPQRGLPDEPVTETER